MPVIGTSEVSQKFEFQAGPFFDLIKVIITVRRMMFRRLQENKTVSEVIVEQNCFYSKKESEASCALSLL